MNTEPQPPIGFLPPGNGDAETVARAIAEAAEEEAERLRSEYFLAERERDRRCALTFAI